MSHFTSMCFSSPLKPQVILCDGHGRNVYDRALDILHIQNIQSLILKADDYMNDHALRKSPEEIGAIGVRHRLLFLHRHRPPGPILEVSPLLPLEVEIETTTKTGLELT